MKKFRIILCAALALALSLSLALSISAIYDPDGDGDGITRDAGIEATGAEIEPIDGEIEPIDGEIAAGEVVLNLLPTDVSDIIATDGHDDRYTAEIADDGSLRFTVTEEGVEQNWSSKSFDIGEMIDINYSPLIRYSLAFDNYDDDIDKRINMNIDFMVDGTDYRPQATNQMEEYFEITDDGGTRREAIRTAQSGYIDFREVVRYMHGALPNNGEIFIDSVTFFIGSEDHVGTTMIFEELAFVTGGEPPTEPGPGNDDEPNDPVSEDDNGDDNGDNESEAAPTNNDDDDSDIPWLIIAIVGGGVILIIIIIAVVAAGGKKKKAASGDDKSSDSK